MIRILSQIGLIRICAFTLSFPVKMDADVFNGSKRFRSITQNSGMSFLISLLISVEIRHCVVIISKHFRFCIRVDQSDEELLSTFDSLRIENIMVGTVLTLFNCVIKIWSISCTIEATISIVSIRFAARTYFPGIWIIVFNFLLLLLK